MQTIASNGETRRAKYRGRRRNIRCDNSPGKRATPKGACQDANSSYRSWFIFNNSNTPCTTADYSGWFGFSGLPEFRDENTNVRDYIYRTPNTNVTQYWFNQGTAGWRFAHDTRTR